jgi:hypothetical protein
MHIMEEFIPEIVTRAMAVSDTIQGASRSYALETAVSRFRRLLSTVPDYAPQELSAHTIDTLGRLAEDVIARIEQRVSSGTDSGAVQLDLVEAVYQIRRALEDIDRWRRHYAGALSQ